MTKLDRSAMIAAGALGAGLAARALLRRARAEDLSGKTVLITGGSRGLGLALAREFARKGCRVAVCARGRAELDAVRHDPSLPEDTLALECDVTDRGRVAFMLDSVLGQFEAIDILVNNAGVIQVGPLDSMNLADFEEAMAVMFWGMVYPTLAILPHMRSRNSGRIVNITSIGGKVAVPHLLPYGCAKFAAVGFSEGLRSELAGTGIKVTTIAPGLMRTGSFLNAWFKGDHEGEATWFGASAALPGLSMGANRAARQIVSATERGDSEKVLTVPARVLAKVHGMFPGLTADVLGLVNRFLLPSGSDSSRRRGHETEVLHRPAMKAVTALGRKAGRRLHQEVAQ